MRRILIIQLRELGDCLHVTPAIRQLRRLHPGATIDVLCERRNEVVYRHNPHVENCIHLQRRCPPHKFLAVAWRLRRQRYDLVVDAQSLPKTAVITRLTGARRRLGFRRPWVCNRLAYTHPYQVGQTKVEYLALSKLRMLRDTRIDFSDLRLDYYLDEEEREEAERFRRRWFRVPVVALNVASRLEHRCWPVEKFAVVADRLADQGFQPFLVYGPGQEKRGREVAAEMRHRPVVDYPMMSFSVLKSILEGCFLFVGNDGGPKHLAAACGLPTIALFGRDHPECWTEPNNPKQRFVTTRSSTRGIPTIGKCLDVDTLPEIPVEAVWNEIKSLIDPGSPRPPAAQSRERS